MDDTAEDIRRARERSLARQADRGPLRLELGCTKCGHTYEYPVGQVLLHPDLEKCRREGWDGVTLGRIIVCKGCGAEDAYELTAHAHVALSAEMVHLAADPPDHPAEAPIVIAEGRLWDGTVHRRPSEAIRHLRKLAEATPEKGEGWRRLGNLLERSERTGEAVEAWHRAALDKDEMEACYSLTTHYLEQQDGKLALDFAAKTLTRIRGWHDTPKMRREAAEEALGVIRQVVEATRQPVALTATWASDPAGGSVVMNVSSMDLREVRRWDRLVDLVASDSFAGAILTDDMPEERPTQLEDLVNGGVVPSAPRGERRMPEVRSVPKVGRNDACPCGSGKKYKKCCGR